MGSFYSSIASVGIDILKIMLPLFFVFAASMAIAQSKSINLDTQAGMKPVNVAIESVTYRGQKALKVTEPPANKADIVEKLLVLPENFHNGTIELDMVGSVAKDAIPGARGFVGVAFRVTADLKKFECIYIRPTNGRADDQVRRNHSVQYISHPDFPWQRLRKEEPEKYESYVDLQPDTWTKVKIVVDKTNARLYVHGNQQPSLVIQNLKLGDTTGAIALWIGPGTEAYFANLRLTQ